VSTIPTVAIVGRVNVGKSTLFNRIAGGRIAIVDDTPGVTRDRNIAIAEWTGHDFFVMDTGGLAPDSEDAFQDGIDRQVRLALEEADAVILVVDAVRCTVMAQEIFSMHWSPCFQGRNIPRMGALVFRSSEDPM